MYRVVLRVESYEKIGDVEEKGRFTGLARSDSFLKNFFKNIEASFSLFSLMK
jgi:hypothetical protein